MVADVMAKYLEFIETGRNSYSDVKNRIEAFILPTLGTLPVSELTTEKLRQWHSQIAKAPPRLRTKPGQPQRFRPICVTEEISAGGSLLPTAYLRF
jgi:hypothetical protein